VTGAGGVVIGVGNEFRRDDGIGPEVLGRLRGRLPAGVRLVRSDGQPAELIEAWTGAAVAVVVDAVTVGPLPADPVTAEPAGIPGRLHRLVLDAGDIPPGGHVSSHGLGLGDAIGLARALDRLPGRLIVHAVEAADVSQGVGLTPAVAAAAGVLADAVLADLAAAARG
jgi:hydrogenase maturation protease